MTTNLFTSGVNTAKLPQYVHQHSKWIIEIPVRILLILVISLIVRALINRSIDRLLRPMTVGGVPALLRPFKERVENSALLESAGLLSQRRAQRAATLASVLKSTVSFLVLVTALLLILGELEISLAPFLAGTSIIGVAVGFGAQNIVKDFLAGIFMTLEDQYGVGDVIDFEKASGTVEAVGLRTTRLRDVNGTVWYVRNGEVVRVGNKSQGFAQVVLDVPIAASANIETASAAMLAVAQGMRAEEQWSVVFLGDPEVQGVESLTREETVIRMVVRVRPLEQWRVARELRRRISEQLNVVAREAQDPPAPTPESSSSDE